MLLWKQTYASEGATHSCPHLSNQDEPWKYWPRPPAGFIDLGCVQCVQFRATFAEPGCLRCGNGLLTHILAAEGYDGHGIDVRARTSWSHYPQSTQERLHVESLDPTTLEAFPAQSTEHPYIRRGVFIIANHADELTPWTPVLATLLSASGYLSIPCCAWAFDEKYQRSSNEDYPMPTGDFIDSLNLGGDGSNSSSYSRYRIWLASLSLYCGWKVESETLRIPSTRNWAIVGTSASSPQMGRKC